MISAPRIPLVLILLGSALTMAGAEQPPATPPETGPYPAVVRYAEANGIATDGFELSGPGEPMQAGDSITVLFTIEEGATGRQWLGEFRAVTLTQSEGKSKPGTGLGVLSVFQSSLKSDTGREFSFEQSPVALEIRTHGPFTREASASAEPTVTKARVLATGGYLAHGLAPMAEIELRLRAAGKKNPGLSFVFRPKFSAEQRAGARARAAEAGFDENDERAYAEGIYALVQFANLAFRTEGVKAITREIADSPTLFSGAFINLDWPGLTLDDGARWGLPGRPVFAVPYNFRSKTTARGMFFATEARPPLQNMAGIIGLTVTSTTKAPGRRLIMRVLAGRRDAAAPR